MSEEKTRCPSSPAQLRVGARQGYGPRERANLIGTTKVVVVGTVRVPDGGQVLFTRRLSAKENRQLRTPPGALVQKLLWWVDPKFTGRWCELAGVRRTLGFMSDAEAPTLQETRRVNFPAKLPGPAGGWISIPSLPVFSGTGCATVELRTSRGETARISFEVREL